MALLKDEVSEVKYKTFFQPVIPAFANNDLLILTTPDAFSQEQITPMIPLIRNCISVAIGKELDVKVELPDSSLTLDMIHQHSSSTPPVTSESSVSQLNSAYTFDSFIVGAGNRFAHAACVSVADGGKQYNPIFLYGGSGLGKTHLMHAVGNAVKAKMPTKKVVYVNCERFVNEFIATIQSGKYDDFREKYRNADFLLIDDIQFLERKEQTQVEFFHTFNELYESGKMILMTCDKPPQSLSSLEERLRSRFSSGLIVDIQPADYETRIAILNRRMQDEHINLSDDIVDYIASNFASNIRELDGAFKTVVAYCFLANSFTLDDAKIALKDMIAPKQAKQVTPDIIVEVVARAYNITVNDIMSNKRSKDIIVPRQICMFLCRSELNMTYPKIGEFFGGKDHSTVLHACNKIELELKDSNSETSIRIDSIKKRLFN
ncbi:MAG: chromosomal replication initiator protein DnaA [Clostridiales bacterium]|nr:chromosomal replication initiator protein DnaA [Clostridiales bacterium]MBR5057351.1 chromosomal replication initiator protein DnaA [Clostridiales bacterium]